MNTPLRDASPDAESGQYVRSTSTPFLRLSGWDQIRLCRPLSAEELQIIRGGMPSDDLTPAA